MVCVSRYNATQTKTFTLLSIKAGVNVSVGPSWWVIVHVIDIVSSKDRVVGVCVCITMQRSGY